MATMSITSNEGTLDYCIDSLAQPHFTQFNSRRHDACTIQSPTCDRLNTQNDNLRFHPVC